MSILAGTDLTLAAKEITAFVLIPVLDRVHHPRDERTDLRAQHRFWSKSNPKLNQTSRTEFATMLARATKNTPSNVTRAFNDVAPTNRAYANVKRLNRVDYPNGFVGSTAMTRIELAKWIANGLAAEDGKYKMLSGQTPLSLQRSSSAGRSKNQITHLSR